MFTRIRDWLRDTASSLDVRLSARLLIKQPVLTLTAGLGIAAAIGISAGFFAFWTSMAHPRIPLDEGDRIVGLENWNVAINNEERHSAADFVMWRTEMKTVVEVSAFRELTLGLETAPATVEDLAVAGMTASGFRVARVPALLGRYIVPDDEQPGAPPVLVIGYDAWQTRFAGDSSIVGRHVRLNETLFTIVGVMPEGFGFPVSHQYWTTLRLDPSMVERGLGPVLFVFGRLAPGATMQSAGAELAAIGRRTAAEFPRTNARLMPQVLPYAAPIMDAQQPGASDGVWAFHVVILLIVIIAAVNVAILVYARTAARRSEIAIRTALGASRRRIVGQLFVEALALSLPPAVFGLALAQYGLRLGTRILEADTGRQPFWTDLGLRPATAAYALGLALLVAAIVGILPALRATGRNVESDLRQLGGATEMQLGKMWTTLVIAQVAFAVAVLPPALKQGLYAARSAVTKLTYSPQDFMTGRLSVKRPPSGGPPPALGTRIGEVVRSLRSNPSITGVTFLADAPTGGRGRIEIEGQTLPPDLDWKARPQAIDTAGLDLYGARLLMGRQFAASDLNDSARVVIVNRSFVRRLLQGRAALGRRLRYVTRPMPDSAAQPPWFEIVGVVDDLARNSLDPDEIKPAVYHPLAPDRLSGVSMVIRTRGVLPATFGATLHQTIAATDPDLQLGTMQPGLANAEAKSVLQVVGTILVLVLGAVLFLCAAGIYALMSFTVMHRRREIGIRTALGASHGQVLIRVLSRVAWQIGAGVAIGAVAAALITSAVGAGTSVPSILLVPVVAVMMVTVGFGAAFVPARRGLAIQPVEALRSE